VKHVVAAKKEAAPAEGKADPKAKGEPQKKQHNEKAKEVEKPKAPEYSTRDLVKIYWTTNETFTWAEANT
jgi:hypothetical protein